LSSLSSQRACPAEIRFPPFRLSKPFGQNYSRLDAWQWVCRQCHGGFAGAAIFPRPESAFAAVPFPLSDPTTKSEFWSSAVTVVLGYTSIDVWIIGF
jgi:hypothetical protein